MKSIIKKLLKDWWQSKGQLALFLFSAILSAWGVSSVIYAYLLTERDFEQNFSASQSADLILSVKDINTAIWSELEMHPAVKEIERREIVSARVLDEDGEWMPMLIFLVEDVTKIKINKFKLTSTTEAWPNAILIEQKGRGFLDMTSNDLEIQLADGTLATMSFGGWVQDARLAPSTMEHVIYGYMEIDQLTAVLSRTEQRLLIKINRADPEVKELQKLAEELSGLIAGKGGQLSAYRIPPPGEHPHQNIVNGVAFLQKSFGWILVFLGIILLSLTFLIWIYAQIIQIGILKAIGANTGQLYASYLFVLSLFVGVGLLLGLPLGYQTAKAYSGFVAMIQNFEPVQVAFPWPVQMTVVLLTAFVPLLLSFWLLRAAIQNNSRQNMQQVFYAPFSGLLGRVQNWITNSKHRYSINNLFRRQGLSLMMVILLAAGSGLFLLGSNLRFSIRQDLRAFFAASDYAISVQAEIGIDDLPLLKDIAGVKATALVRHRPVSFISPEGNIESSSTLKLFPKDYAFSDQLLIKGQLDRNCANCLYINQGHLPEFRNHAIGDRIKMVLPSGDIQEWKFAGVIKDIGALPNFYQFTQEKPEYFDELAFQLSDEIPLGMVIKDIERTFASHNFTIKHLQNTDRTTQVLQDHLDISFVSIQVLGGGTIALGLLGLLLLIALMLRERTPEIGILKAIGASLSAINALIGLEVSIITITGSLVGVVLAGLFTPFFSRLYGEMLLHTGFMPSLDVLMMVGLVLVLYLLQLGLNRWYLSRKLKKKTLHLIN